ncbi:MAG: hypothetical protein J6N95_06840 [Bacilli bacterium]|nr:hypothetical protein [Bacilli bacterium]
MKWFLKHFKIALAILMFGVTAIVVSVVMISSYTSYKNYEKTYYANDLEVRSTSAAAPKTVEINDTFKSKYKKSVSAEANEYTTDGKIALDLFLEEKSFADIDIHLNYEVSDNLMENMNIKVNGSLIEDEIAYKADGWHHLILANFALPQGDLKVEIEGVKNKEMPEIGNIKVFASEAIKFAQPAE